MFGAWTSLNPGFQGGVYQDVYFLPGNTQVGYACGAGLDTVSHLPAGLVIKTTDGGSSWTRQNPNTPNMLLAIYFSSTDIGYACGIAGTWVKTTDAGITWVAGYVGHNDQLTYVSLPSNGQTGYIGATSDTAKVYRSTGPWAKIGDSLSRSTSCAMADDSSGVAFGLGGFLWGTADGFDTGKFLNPNTNANIVAGAFSRGDPNRAYIVGTDTVLHIGVVRYASTGSQQGVWDSVRCPVVQSLSCVDYPTPETAFVGGANGFIGRTWGTHDIWRTNTGVTNQINGICFPNGPDTGYAAAGPLILKTTDAGGPPIDWVAEGKSPVTVRAGIRVVSNPSRRGISYDADAEARVTVFDAVGKVVARQNAAKGMNFLPLTEAGVYMLKATAADFTTTRKLVVER
jgi:hypothetical protein